MSFIEPESPFFVELPRSSAKLPSAITAAEALSSDLPPFTRHLDGTLKRGARHFDQFMPYRGGLPSGYAMLMRRGGVYDHTIRSLSDRDFEIIRRMKPDGGLRGIF